MADTFVSIDKRMICDEREAQGDGFFLNARVKIGSFECHTRLGERRFKRAKVAYSRRSSTLRHDAPVQVENLREGEVSHPLRQAAVKLSIFVENPSGCALKLLIGARH